MNDDKYPIEHQEKKFIKRISWKKMFADALDAFDFEKGAAYTIKMLLINPGKVVRGYMYENRFKYINPFRFLAISTTLIVFLYVRYIDFGSFYQGFVEGMNEANSPEEFQDDIGQFMDLFKSYFNLLLLSTIPFLMLASYWVFKRPKYNLAEHLYINVYLMSAINVIGILLIPILLIPAVNGDMYLIIYYITYIIYQIYYYTEVFDGQLVGLFFRALLALLLSVLLYSTFTIILTVTYLIFING